MRYIIPLVLLFCISGCATVKDTVVLVPDADGRVGQVTIATQGGSRTLTDTNTAVEVTQTEKLPSLPYRMEQKKIDTLFGDSFRALPPEPVSFLLYFLHSTAELTAKSKAYIPEVLAIIKKRSQYEISIIGHADTTGNDEYNMKLSSERAEAVKAILFSKGINSGNIELRYHGKRDPLVPTGDNVNEPRNRRVEVVVK
jgi:outer membrane protein OmpA-like peptidoglycan-associated protein